MSEVLITVVVPVYNTENFLKRCVESIIGQTYQNLDIILVNDGATDLSGRICDEFRQQDKRVRVIHKKNGGLSSARNAGIDIAQGSYICFIDSDDYIEEHYVERLYQAIQRYEADIAQCGLIRGEADVFPQIEEVKVYQQCTGPEYLRKYFDKSIDGLGLCVNKLYNITLFDGIRYPDGRVHEDVATVYKLLYKANMVVYNNQPLYYYYMTTQSIMRGRFNLNRLDWATAMEEKLSFIKEHNETELYNRSLQEYIAVLLKLYYNVKKNYSNEKNILQSLLWKSKRTIKESMPVKEISPIIKFLFIVSKICPYGVGAILDRII